MQMRNPHPPRQGLSGPVRLVIVAAGLAFGAWLLIPAYVESAREIRQQMQPHDHSILPGRRIINSNSIGARNHSGVEPYDVFGLRGER